MKNSIIVLLILGALSLSCSNSTSSNEEETISLPLKVGNSWTYNITITNNQENPISSRQESNITFTALSDTIIDGVQWFYIESGNSSFDTHKAGYYSNQEDGIYFSRSFKNPSPEKKSSVSFALGMDIFSIDNANLNEEKRLPFLHNPDAKIPERLIKTENVIGSVTYEGESKNQDFNSLTQDYIWNYYQQSIGSRTFAINPFDLNFSVSNDLGFVTYESAYVSTKGSTDDDPRLQLLLKYRFELTEFNGN